MKFKKLKRTLKPADFLLPIVLIVIFSLIGFVVFLFKQKLRYFFLFSGMGTIVAAFEVINTIFPGNRQTLRRITQAIIGGGLFLGLSLCVKVNFQFSEVIFDIFALTATGAVIQLIIARLIMPFFIGNAFCSWVCWDGAIFEAIQGFMPKSRTVKKRSIAIALSYFAFIVIIASAVANYRNPAFDENARFWWIVGDNFLILGFGIVLSLFWGSRFYCRMLCPFISISGLISKYSIFKIKPLSAQRCIGCNKCNKACPMLIDVSSFVKSGKSINSRSCIVCERCVASCDNSCLKLAPGLPWK
jgi:polyferredoxin